MRALGEGTASLRTRLPLSQMQATARRVRGPVSRVQQAVRSLLMHPPPGWHGNATVVAPAEDMSLDTATAAAGVGLRPEWERRVEASAVVAVTAALEAPVMALPAGEPDPDGNRLRGLALASEDAVTRM